MLTTRDYFDPSGVRVNYENKIKNIFLTVDGTPRRLMPTTRTLITGCFMVVFKTQ